MNKWAPVSLLYGIIAFALLSTSTLAQNQGEFDVTNQNSTLKAPFNQPRPQLPQPPRPMPEGVHKHSLVEVIPGINDQASSYWYGQSSALSATHQRYVITYDDGPDLSKLPFGQFLRPAKEALDRLELQGVNRVDLKTQKSHAPVMETHYFRIKDPNSTEAKALLRQIAEAPSATVVVDMHIGVRVSEKTWGPQVEWASSVGSNLAKAHLAKYPDSYSVLVGHSAGTEAVRKIGAEKIITANNERPLFNLSIAESPRRRDGFSRDTLLVIGDGDFYYSPGGHLPTTVTMRGEKEAQELQKSGNTVIRLVNDTGFILPRTQHTNLTNMYAPDRTFVIYPRDSQKSIPLSGTSLATAIRTMANSSTEARVALDSHNITKMADTIRKTEPTPGIGGVSLNATASVPIDPQQIRDAGYDATTRRLYLRLLDNKRVFLPRLDDSVMPEVFRIVYVQDNKPELSIGRSNFEHETATGTISAGRSPVHYLGGVRDTLLGLVMYQADVALGRLAFGSTASVQSVRQYVSAFRSLPELFPAKYTDNPGSEKYGGQNVFMNCLSVELGRDGSESLRFVTTLFSIRFGHSGPAETYFSQMFQANFADIVNAEVASPLRALVPYAQATAVFRWLKTNNITFSPLGLPPPEQADVFTPRETLFAPAPTLEDIDPPLPTIFFGPFGPQQIKYPGGRSTSVTYREGLPIKIVRSDGSTLDIFRDDLGGPLSLQLNGLQDAAFYVDKDLGLLFAENIGVERGTAKQSLRVRPDTIIYPDTNPETTVRLIGGRFLDQP